MEIYSFAQFSSNLETDSTDDGELHAVLQMVCHEVLNWHYLSVYRAEIATTILFNPSMHFLPLAN